MINTVCNYINIFKLKYIVNIMIELKDYIGVMDPAYKFIKDLSKMSLMDEDEKRRNFAVRALDGIFDNNLVSGQMVDNQFFLEVKIRGKPVSIYVGDLRKYHDEYRALPHPFRIR